MSKPNLTRREFLRKSAQGTVAAALVGAGATAAAKAVTPVSGCFAKATPYMLDRGPARLVWGDPVRRVLTTGFRDLGPSTHEEIDLQELAREYILPGQVAQTNTGALIVENSMFSDGNLFMHSGDLTYVLKPGQVFVHHYIDGGQVVLKSDRFYMTTVSGCTYCLSAVVSISIASASKKGLTHA